MAKQTTLDKFFNTYWLKTNKKREKSYGSNPQFKSKIAKNGFYKLRLKNRATPAEKLFGDYLWENKIYFIFQKGFIKPFHIIVDFYIPTYGIIIEIDGEYHKNIVRKDTHRDYSFLNKRGFTTMRITNQEVFNGDFKKKIDLLFFNK